MNKGKISIFLSLILLLMSSISAYAQEGKGKFSIDFIKGDPLFEEVLKQAKEQRKYIFVDCFAVWCGPCKQLDAKTFTEKAVGDFINPLFIAVKYDIEKGNGLKFYNKYSSHIPGVPTMLIIDHNGDVMHSIVGFRNSTDLIKELSEALKGHTLSNMQKKYEAGERDLDFMLSYVEGLKGAFKNREAERVVRDYVAELPLEALYVDQVWKMASPYISNPYQPDYQFVVNNSFKFKYNNKIQYPLFMRNLKRGMGRAVEELLNKQLSGEWTATTTDSLAILRKVLNRKEVDDSYSYLAQLEIMEMMDAGKTIELLDRINAYNTIGLLDNYHAYMRHVYAYLVEKITDPATLQVCLENLLKIQKIENDTRIPFNFYNTISKAYEKLERTQEAKVAYDAYTRLKAINDEQLKSFRSLFE